MLKAWTTVVITVTACALSEYLLVISPWYLLPFVWAFAGTAFTGVSDLVRVSQADQSLVFCDRS
jgi:hypothetical protein